MPRLIATCGTSTIRAGTTRMSLGAVKKDGTLIVREMHRHFPAFGSDGSRRKQPASVKGANTGVLGEWVERDIEVPDDTALFLTYSIKSSSMPLPKQLVFALKVAETLPYMEMLFPVVVDAHSTLTELPISGRFSFMSSEEINAHRDKAVGFGRSLSHDNAVATLEQLSEEGVLNYWKALSSPENTDGKIFLNIEGNGSFEEYPIIAKYMLPGKRAGEVLTKGKVVKTVEGRKVRITSRKRKIKLS